MAFSPAAKSALRSLGASKAHYNPNQPRDPHTGEWTDGGGATPMAGKVAIAPDAQAIFDRMRAEKKSEAQILKAMEEAGVVNPRAQFGAMLRAQRKLTGPVRVKLPPKPDVPLDTRSPLEVGREAWGETTNQWDVRRKIEESLIRAETGKMPATMMQSGMSTPQPMYTTKWEQMDIHYTSEDPRARAYAASILASAARNDLPVELTAHTHSIMISSQRDRWDADTAKKFGLPNFTSGGDIGWERKMTIYAVSLNHADTAPGLVAHEMGHAMATATYGNSTPPPTSAIGKLYAKWKADPYNTPPPPTDYGKHNPAEALAESVAARYIPGYRGAGISNRWRAAVDETIAESRAILLRKAGKIT